MEHLLLVDHLDKVIMSFHPLEYFEGSLPVQEKLVLTGWQQDQDLISFFKSSVLGSGAEVMLLTDLTPAELIMSEITSLLKFVSEVHDVLVRGLSFGILLFLGPKLAEDLEWSIHGATIEHFKWCKSETFLRSFTVGKQECVNVSILVSGLLRAHPLEHGLESSIKSFYQPIALWVIWRGS